MRFRERRVGGIAIERECEAVGADDADQRRAAHHHLADRQRRCIGIGNAHGDIGVRQCALVDHLDDVRTRRSP